jgi:pimeloyl-ACP methyl ester carboxylesterase
MTRAAAVVEPPGWAHREAVLNGVRLHYVEAGSGPPVILLHGFPEFWYSWRRQISALAEAGFRVLAPDLRGYNLSARPPGVRAYRLEALTADVAALVHHAGARSAAVAGHDWGGMIAWHMPLHQPETIDKLIILNSPHPAAYWRELRRGPRQWLRSWYILFFQMPWLPEVILGAGNGALLGRVLRRIPSVAFSDADVRLYRRALTRTGALTAALNYYRAAFWRGPRLLTEADRPIRTPTLVIWGERDPYLGLRLTQGLERWASNLRVERLAEAGHWVQNEAPERVNRLMIDFLKGR